MQFSEVARQNFNIFNFLYKNSCGAFPAKVVIFALTDPGTTQNSFKPVSDPISSRSLLKFKTNRPGIMNGLMIWTWDGLSAGQLPLVIVQIYPGRFKIDAILHTRLNGS